MAMEPVAEDVFGPLYECSCCGRHVRYPNRCSWCINQCKGGKHTRRGR
ncbi:hypothetical protein LCGC14_1216910 [marine sediment metagenome]|uniref:Uncharacterized protein n=1 Tax=marine sediment metagenome TaxID=412755 RepID=A0A0F9LZS4_9ZZZZ